MSTCLQAHGGATTSAIVRRFAGLTFSLVAAIAPSALNRAHAAGTAAWDDVKDLASTAYFSDVCAREAVRLGIAHTRDAQFLIAAFAERLRASAPDARAEERAGSLGQGPGVAGCRLPAVALTNLLRLNGVAAELALASMEPAGFVPNPATKAGGLLVYVPSLDRYVDPAATERSADPALDRMIKTRAVRTHLIGPALDDRDPAACHGVCVRLYQPHREGDVVRVKTEAIRLP